MGLTWDVDKAVKHLQTNAASTSQGMCAKYTRQAIEAGGVTLARHGSAKDYGPSLTAVGFQALNYSPAAFKKGDIAIIDAFTGHPHGHMMMYDGTQWISDFKQRTFYPGAAYRKAQPSYTIYRYPPQQAQPPTAESAFHWLGTPWFSCHFDR